MNWKVTAPSRGFKFCNWSVFMENHISRQLLLKFVSAVCESGNRCGPVPSDTDQHRDSHPLAGTKKPTVYLLLSVLWDTLESYPPHSIWWLLQLESSNIYWPAPPRVEYRLNACAVLNLCHISINVTFTYCGENRTFQNLASVIQRHHSLKFRSRSRTLI